MGAGILVIAMTACGGNDKAADKAKPGNAATAAVTTGDLPNYRFIDTDSIGLKYNLSIDFNEQMIKLQNNLQEEERRQRSTIQARADALQNKINNAQQAQSQSEIDALQQEYANLQNLQAQAEQKLQRMSIEIENTLTANAQIMMDSLNNFLREYAAARGYDAVFVKASAPYYNPALDVTDEVIEGLNARYNKVKK